MGFVNFNCGQVIRNTDLSWNASRNDNNLDALEGMVELVGRIPMNLRDLRRFKQKVSGTLYTRTHLTVSINVTDVRSYTRSSTDIIKAERSDERIAFE